MMFPILSKFSFFRLFSPFQMISCCYSSLVLPFLMISSGYLWLLGIQLYFKGVSCAAQGCSRFPGWQVFSSVSVLANIFCSRFPHYSQDNFMAAQIKVFLTKPTLSVRKIILKDKIKYHSEYVCLCKTMQ